MRLKRLSFVLAVAASVFAAEGAPPLSVHLGEVDYLHRWSKAGQNEFTPKGQEDLDHWTDMVTIDVHEAVLNGDQLKTLADQVLESYGASGKVLGADQKPATKDAPAEYFAAAVLGPADAPEATFARFLLREGRGVVVIYAHRVSGPKAETEMGTWLKNHGSEMDKTLRGWEAIPSLARLRGLPQSP
jgi:hypothetical protein